MIPIPSRLLAAQWVLLLLGWAPAYVMASEPKAEQPSDQRIVTIVTLGDSITKGVRGGVSKEQTFSAMLETRLKQNGPAARVVNFGIGGERTDQALQRLKQVIELKPDIVTVMYGTNDSYIDQGKSASCLTLKEYQDNLTRIVTELLRRGILPVLMTEPRWSDDAPLNGAGENPNLRLEAYVVACREIARSWRVPLVDHFARWSEAHEKGISLRQWTTDGCHPNPTGHGELAELMQPVIHRAIGPELHMRQKLLAGNSLRIVCFGDSVTGVYYHTGSRRAYTDMLGIALNRVAPEAKLELINAGISGHTTVNALARINRDVLDRKPDLVTVMFGLNDMTRVPLDEYRANLKTIVSKCRTAGSEVVLLTPNNVVSTGGRPTEKLIPYCDVVRALGAELQLPVCDVYRELDADRAYDPFNWRLMMSDEIHPNMDGHKRIAVALAQAITGVRVTLDDVPPPRPALARTVALLRSGKSVRALAMPPFDHLIGPALRELYPAADIIITSWPVADSSLARIEQDTKERVRKLKPDLVLLAVPGSAAAGSPEAFARSYSWTMNWSLNFGPPTWDCVVIHPSVIQPAVEATDRDELIRRLVRAQDLTLIDRPAGNRKDVAGILSDWLNDSVKTIVLP